MRPDVQPTRVRNRRRTVVAGVALVAVAGLLTPVMARTAVAPAPGDAVPRVAFVARADNPIDALAAAAVAGPLGAPVFLSFPPELHPDAADGLRAFDPELVVLAGGEAALSPQVLADVEALGFTARRVAGSTRTSTASALAAFAAELGHGRPLLAGATTVGDAGIDGDLGVTGELTVDRLVLTTASGAPIVVASSAMVEGLNVEQLGGFTAPQLQAGTLKSLSCAAGEVAKFDGTSWDCAADDFEADTDTDTDTLATLSCATDQVAKFDGTSWDCATDDFEADTDTDTDTLADLGCAATQVAKFNGTSWSCAADDFEPDTDTDTLADLGCAATQVAKFNGTSWSCAADDFEADTDTLATLGCGADQLALFDGSQWNCGDLPPGGSDTLSDLNCGVGQVAKWDGAAWICAEDVDTTDPNTDTLAMLSCASGEVAKWDGDAWACGADIDTTEANTDTLASLSCAGGQVAKWNGSDWACAADNFEANTDALASLSCAAGQVAKWNGSAWTCAADNFEANTDALASLSCAGGQVAKWNGSAWTCAADNNTDTLAGLSCADGSSVSWNEDGRNWVCGRPPLGPTSRVTFDPWVIEALATDGSALYDVWSDVLGRPIHDIEVVYGDAISGERFRVIAYDVIPTGYVTDVLAGSTLVERLEFVPGRLEIVDGPVDETVTAETFRVEIDRAELTSAVAVEPGEVRWEHGRSELISPVQPPTAGAGIDAFTVDWGSGEDDEWTSLEPPEQVPHARGLVHDPAALEGPMIGTAMRAAGWTWLNTWLVPDQNGDVLGSVPIRYKDSDANDANDVKVVTYEAVRPAAWRAPALDASSSGETVLEELSLLPDSLGTAP